MMTINAQIHAAQEATVEACEQLAAATAHLEDGNLDEVEQHLVLAGHALDTARQQTHAAAARAAAIALAEAPPNDDISRYLPKFSPN